MNQTLTPAETLRASYTAAYNAYAAANRVADLEDALRSILKEAGAQRFDVQPIGTNERIAHLAHHALAAAAERRWGY